MVVLSPHYVHICTWTIQFFASRFYFQRLKVLLTSTSKKKKKNVETNFFLYVTAMTVLCVACNSLLLECAEKYYKVFGMDTCLFPVLTRTKLTWWLNRILHEILVQQWYIKYCWHLCFPLCCSCLQKCHDTLN